MKTFYAVFRVLSVIVLTSGTFLSGVAWERCVLAKNRRSVGILKARQKNAADYKTAKENGGKMPCYPCSEKKEDDHQPRVPIKKASLVDAGKSCLLTVNGPCTGQCENLVDRNPNDIYFGTALPIIVISNNVTCGPTAYPWTQFCGCIFLWNMQEQDEYGNWSSVASGCQSLSWLCTDLPKTNPCLVLSTQPGQYYNDSQPPHLAYYAGWWTNTNYMLSGNLVQCPNCTMYANGSCNGAAILTNIQDGAFEFYIDSDGQTHPGSMP